MITKEPVPIRGVGLTMFRAWQYAAGPAMAIPFACVAMKEYPFLWVQILAVVAAIAFIALMTWGTRRKDLQHGFARVSGFAVLAGFLIGGTIWGLMLFARIKNGKLDLMSNLASANTYLFFWPLLFAELGSAKADKE